MSDFRLNPERMEAFLRKYSPDGEVRPGREGTSEFVMLCPSHPDNKASFSMNLHKGLGRCFSCNANTPIIELVAKLESKTTAQAESLLHAAGVYEKAPKPRKNKDEKHTACDVSDAQITQWEDALRVNAQALSVLTAATGWTPDTMRRFRIGYDGVAYTIPLHINTDLINVKFYKPKGQPKYRGIVEHNAPILWPLENMLKEGPVWLMEGEKDCILANQCGLNAVTFTGGAGSIPHEYVTRFRGRVVYIVYDIDAPGRSGAQVAASILARVASQVKVVTLPEEGLPANGDFTDFIHHTKHDITELHVQVSLTAAYQLPSNSIRDEIADTVVDTYLDEVIRGKHFQQRVRLRARVVSAALGKTFLVPLSVTLECPRSQGKACIGCALFMHEGAFEYTLRVTDAAIMQMIEATDGEQQAAIRKFANVSLRCPMLRFKFHNVRSFFPIVLIPALEREKARHTYIMQIAWALDVFAEANEDYLVEAVVMSNPKTQAMILVCYKLDKDVASVDQFELTPEMIKELRIFQCPQLPKSSTSSTTSISTSPQTLPASTDEATCTSPSISDTTPPSDSSSTTE